MNIRKCIACGKDHDIADDSLIDWDNDVRYFDCPNTSDRVLIKNNNTYSKVKTECIEHYTEKLLKYPKEIDKRIYKEIVLKSYQEGFQAALESLKVANDSIQAGILD